MNVPIFNLLWGIRFFSVCFVNIFKATTLFPIILFPVCSLSTYLLDMGLGYSKPRICLVFFGILLVPQIKTLLNHFPIASRPRLRLAAFNSVVCKDKETGMPPQRECPPAAAQPGELAGCSGLCRSWFLRGSTRRALCPAPPERPYLVYSQNSIGG